jgi:formylglycine-generating enzyme required for sulfatase activity
MPFCSNCGNKIGEEVKFCPECGYKIKDASAAELQTQPEEPDLASKQKTPASNTDRTYSVLEQGHIFQEHYRIEKNIGKDNDGITYLVTDIRNEERRSLKIFHPSYFANVDKMLGAVVNMSKVKTISHPNLAKVYEIKQSGKPAFIVSEYIEGMSLAAVKELNPDKLKEETCREIVRQLTDAAITIRKAGLAVRYLNLNNIVLTEGNKPVILASGVNYDVSDERDDIFNFGVLLAKLFSTTPFFETLYTVQKIAERRFDYISGITVEVNDIISACLQKGMLSRFTRFDELDKALSGLKPYNPDDVYIAYETTGISYKDEHMLKLPERRLDVYFWLAVIFIAAFIFVMLGTNLLDTIFSREKTTFRFTGFVTDNADTVEVTAPPKTENYRKPRTELPRPEPRLRQESALPGPVQQTVNPTIVVPPPPVLPRETFDSQTTHTQTQTQTQSVAHPPKDMIYISSDTFAYGYLRPGVKVNASLSGFYISPTELTQAEWNKYMNPADYSTAGDNLPADNVSWFDIITYCNARSEAEGLTPAYKVFGTGVSRSVSCNFKANGYRLPTEAEWEYAARAKLLHPYSGSDSPDGVAWYFANSGKRLHQVKTKTANAFKLYDMTGNVSEWCWDWHDVNYPKNMPYLNPTGPDLGTQRAIRGGSAVTEKGSALEVIYRARGNPSAGYPLVGFRLVRTR